MRLVGLVLAMLVVVAAVVAAVPARAHADDRALKPYAGKLVISPDSPPVSVDELPAFLKANITKDSTYDLIKGPPWPFHMVAVLAKDAKTVTLVIVEKGDKKQTALFSVDLAPMRRIVIAHTEATVAAGFASEKTYVVRVLAGKKELARCELTLRP